ncbi:hypothetical protein KP509_15G031600 [Ceratopteris richardii]|uniref:RAB6-interacting golgin n=1 Tax=Ceratopteris richardii TaxID=49495 RepID=A0A8T2T269_CERRI|nr:hypothetical protein KP509_15G031600 [Ceratopteris richardii]KAH7404555.1 hypothetical protein KP509_15G031600 [Ceratopteris richardii]
MESTPTPKFVFPIGPDGLPLESPVIAYTEKVLEEKELELKRYIEVNYSKIRNVERELASLALEIKLTAGPKKAALEHLRKKIELSGEKIKLAKQREEQAKKAWEAAANALKEEEDNKQKLCDDLNQLVQESAASQYSRLEELKKKLESLNHEVTGGTPVLNVREPRTEPDQSQPGSQKECLTPQTIGAEKRIKDAADEDGASKLVSERVPTKSSTPDNVKAGPAQPVSQGSRNSTLSKPARGRSAQVKGHFVQKTKANSWTGAGFDVDERLES